MSLRSRLPGNRKNNYEFTSPFLAVIRRLVGQIGELRIIKTGKQRIPITSPN